MFLPVSKTVERDGDTFDLYENFVVIHFKEVLLKIEKKIYDNIY